MSNSLDPDQDRHFVSSELGLNCLQTFSADNKNCRGIMYHAPLFAVTYTTLMKRNLPLPLILLNTLTIYTDFNLKPE